MKVTLAATAICALAIAPASAATVNVDLSSAATGTVVNGVGASFAQLFAGESLSGNSVTGTPTGPLALQAAGNIEVAFFNPGVSAASNSLLSTPGNQGPLAVLLGANASSITFTSGSFNGGTVSANFFANNGALLGTRVLGPTNGYNVFTFSGLGTFRGIQFLDNVDPAGVRFQNFSYLTAGVPEPATWSLMILGFGMVGYGMRRRSSISGTTLGVVA